MIDQEKLRELVDQALTQEGAYLVDLQLTDGDKIHLEVDRAGGIPLSAITGISRFIEGGLDREEIDFSLEVASPGVGKPFKVVAQYAANQGRPVKVQLNDGTELIGDMIAADAEKITLQWKERVPKEQGKGKQTVEVQREIAIKDIKQTKLEVRF